MGNPVITRLGINQFWYNHWYSDTNYTKNIKEDSTLTLFISFYLSHGASFQTHPFLHEYWYKKPTKQYKFTKQTKQNLQAFRRYFYTNDRLGIEHSYFIRYKTGEFFPMRLWIMRYGEWIFFSVHWFKPIKSKSFLRRNSRKKIIGAISRSTARVGSLKRLSLLNQFMSSSTFKKQQYTF